VELRDGSLARGANGYHSRSSREGPRVSLKSCALESSAQSTAARGGCIAAPCGRTTRARLRRLIVVSLKEVFVDTLPAVFRSNTVGKMAQAQEWSQSEGEFPHTFFDAINQADGDAVVAVVTAVARAADGTLTPRAAELDSIGEWDSKMELGLVCLGGHCCPGKVGQGGVSRICGRPKSECTVLGHKKATGVVEPGWYISAGAKNAGVFEEPRLPIERDGGPITSRGAAFLMDGEASFKLPKGRWTLAIEAFLAAKAPAPAGLSVQIPKGDEEEEAEKLSPDSYEQITFTPVPSVQFAAEPVAVAGATPEPGQGQSRSVTNVGGQGGGWGDDEDDDDEDDVYGMFGSGGSVRRGMGERPEADGDRNTLLRQVRAAVRGVMGEAEEQIRELAARNRATTLALEERINSLTSDLDDTRAELSDERRNLRITRETVAGEQRATEALMRRVEGVQAQTDANARELCTRASAPAPTATAALGNDVARCTHALFNNQGVVPLLRTQFTAFRERLESGGGIECHGVKFSSKKQLLSWYEAQNLAHPAIFLDALAVMHGIRATYKDPLDALKEVEMQGRVQYKSTLESALKNSFAYPVPPILTGGKRDTEGLGMFDVLKGALKTYQAWKPDDEPFGVAMQIEEGVENVYTRWAEYRESITTDPDLTVLSAGLLTDSKLFLVELVRYVNDQNHELLKGSAYIAAQVWAMQLECLATIFKELAAVRAGAESSGQQHAGYYVWAMLRAWEIQQRYRKNKFKDDPALTGIMVRRIVVQGGDGGFMAKMKQLEDAIKSLEQKSGNQAGEIRKLQALKPQK
jgi:hypothetical protein